jgi:hypothetical protein
MTQRHSIGSKGRRFERVFVLRVWREGGSGPREAIRGSVIELGSGRRFFFTQLADLKDYLSLCLTASDPGEP